MKTTAKQFTTICTIRCVLLKQANSPHQVTKGVSACHSSITMCLQRSGSHNQRQVPTREGTWYFFAPCCTPAAEHRGPVGLVIQCTRTSHLITCSQVHNPGGGGAHTGSVEGRGGRGTPPGNRADKSSFPFPMGGADCGGLHASCADVYQGDTINIILVTWERCRVIILAS